MEEENTDKYTYTHLHKPDLECKHSKTGYCGDECILMEGEKCPYEDEINKNHKGKQ